MVQPKMAGQFVLLPTARTQWSAFFVFGRVTH